MARSVPSSHRADLIMLRILRKLAGMMHPRWRAPARCESCGEQFICGAWLGGCWCAEIKLDRAARAELRAKYSRCLCRACLMKFARGGGSDASGRMTFIASLVAALALAVAGVELGRRLAGPKLSPAASIQSAADYLRRLRDSSGAELVISAPPRRIVSQTLGTDEILLAICSPERIVGLSPYALDPRYSNVAEQASSIAARPVRGAEDILSLDPDLIFVASYSRAETVELLRSAGAPVFRFSDFSTVESIKANIRTVAYAVGEEARGQELIAWMERQIESARARIVPGRSPRVMSYDPWSGTSAGAGTLFDDMLRLVGAINVVAEHGLTGFPKVSDEQILKWQPDFIVIGAEAGKFDEARRRLLQNPALARSEAARAGRIIAIDYRHLLAVSHHIARGIQDLAEGIYGGAR